MHTKDDYNTRNTKEESNTEKQNELSKENTNSPDAAEAADENVQESEFGSRSYAAPDADNKDDE